jgi:hypothetical protein
MEYTLKAVVDTWPNARKLPDGRVEITLYSSEPIETEVAVGHIPGLIFGKKFSTHWVEYWQNGKMIDETTLRPLDWFILRHLHRNGTSEISDIEEAMHFCEDPDFKKPQSYFMPVESAKQVRKRISSILQVFGIPLDVSLLKEIFTLG